MNSFMSKRLIAIVCSILVLAVASPALFADEENEHKTPPTTQRGPRPDGMRPPGQRPLGGKDLEHSMESMERSLKKLESQIADPAKNASSIELIQQIQAATLVAKSIVPGRIMRLPEAERAEKIKDYRSMMISLLRLETDLEENLVDNDNTKAAEALQQMHDLEKKGHDEFRGKEHH